ncbi:sialin-like [Mytilus galloprovincialis]|uniref:sialin-like n=1 Tax=Mytilus galloprovincialis TaxID=29158 RepID=UPI003F7BC402
MESHDGNLRSDSSSEKRSVLPPAEESHDVCPRQWALSRFPKRYIVAIMAFLGFCNIYSLRANLSVAIVAMVAKKEENVTAEYQGDFPTYDWSIKQEDLVLSSFFYGYIFTQLPGGYLANRIGGKYLFGGGIFMSALLTVLTPLFAKGGVGLIVAIRVLAGLCEGVTYPSILAVWAKWAPPLERTKLATIAFSGSYIGTVISMLLSGYMLESGLGWPSIFYLFGGIALLWCVCWGYFIAESPSSHPTITSVEVEYIQANIGYTEEQTKNILPPWTDIFKSPAVWAIVAAHFAENWGFYTWLRELPSIMRHDLNFRIDKAGFVAAFPYLVMGSVVMSSGFFADYIYIYLRGRAVVSTTAIRKLFTCGAFFFRLIFMVAAGYSMTPVVVYVCLALSVGLGGFAWAGFSVNHLDIAPQYASVTMGISNTFATIPGIISPLLTGAIIQNTDVGLWQILFYIDAAIYLLGAVFYGIFATGNRQKWAEVPTGFLSQIDVDIDKDL